jgi:hypothetical protein
MLTKHHVTGPIATAMAVTPTDYNTTVQTATYNVAEFGSLTIESASNSTLRTVHDI